MKKPVRMHWYRRILQTDGQHALAATYEEAGSFPGYLLPGRMHRSRNASQGQFLLMTGTRLDMHPEDRIAMGGERYRILQIRHFPRHTEALLEKEAS